MYQCGAQLCGGKMPADQNNLHENINKTHVNLKGTLSVSYDNQTDVEEPRKHNRTQTDQSFWMRRGSQ